MTEPMTEPGTEPGTENEDTGNLDVKLLELLVCPLTKGSLKYDAENSELISEKAKLAYPVRGGIPIMLPSDARALE